MVNECESVSLAYLSLQSKQKTQHQFRAKSHRRTDIANHHNFRFAYFVAITDFHRHALILKISPNGGLRIENSGLGAFLTQCDPRTQYGGQSLHLALQDLFIS